MTYLNDIESKYEALLSRIEKNESGISEFSKQEKMKHIASLKKAHARYLDMKKVIWIAPLNVFVVAPFCAFTSSGFMTFLVFASGLVLFTVYLGAKNQAKQLENILNTSQT